MVDLWRRDETRFVASVLDSGGEARNAREMRQLDVDEQRRSEGKPRIESGQAFLESRNIIKEAT